MKRAAVICPTGTLDDASLAATSSKGAVKQNPSISVTPVSTLSEEDMEDVTFVMFAYKYVYEGASRRSIWQILCDTPLEEANRANSYQPSSQDRGPGVPYHGILVLKVSGFDAIISCHLFDFSFC